MASDMKINGLGRAAKPPSSPGHHPPGVTGARDPVPPRGKNMRKASRYLLLAIMVTVSAAGSAFAEEDEDEDTSL